MNPKFKKIILDAVAHTYHPSYVGSIGRIKIQAKNTRPYLKITKTKKGLRM
jgi:hypothetical protein